jgi:hypothetical protein
VNPLLGLHQSKMLLAHKLIRKTQDISIVELMILQQPHQTIARVMVKKKNFQNLAQGELA